jgi:hypothetical protein
VTGFKRALAVLTATWLAAPARAQVPAICMTPMAAGAQVAPGEETLSVSVSRAIKAGQ